MLSIFKVETCLCGSILQRGRQIVVARAQSGRHEGRQMADALLYGWLYGGWNLEQSLLRNHIVHHFDGQSSDRSGYADIGRCGWLFAIVPVNTTESGGRELNI